EQRMRERVAVIRRERERLQTRLSSLPDVRKVFPSQANFLTARFDDAGERYRLLAEQGIVVRDVGRYPGLAHCRRASIGSAEENARMLDTLAQSGVTA